MTEAELFAAYRTLAGYQAQCACGTWITAPSSATTQQIAKIVRIHNESTEHAQFSADQEAVYALQRKPVHICKCHDHGGN
jgi:hypothetical protein